MWARQLPASGQPDAAVGVDPPVRVVGDLPGVAIGVEEDRAVAAPEGLGRLATDRRAGGAGLLDRGVDRIRRADVERQRDAAPAATILDAAVLGKSGAVPERDDHATGLEKDDIVAGLGARRPAERLVEAARPAQIRHAERD